MKFKVWYLFLPAILLALFAFEFSAGIHENNSAPLVETKIIYQSNVGNDNEEYEGNIDDEPESEPT